MENDQGLPSLLWTRVSNTFCESPCAGIEQYPLTSQLIQENKIPELGELTWNIHVLYFLTNSYDIIFRQKFLVMICGQLIWIHTQFDLTWTSAFRTPYSEFLTWPFPGFQIWNAVRQAASRITIASQIRLSHVTTVVLAVPNNVEHYFTIPGPFPSLFLV